MWIQLTSWIALVLGVSANFWAGTSRKGWALNVLGSIFWIIFGILIHNSAEWLASGMFMIIGIRNYLIGSNNRPGCIRCDREATKKKRREIDSLKK